MAKPEIAARVAHSGAGIDLRTGTPSRARASPQPLPPSRPIRGLPPAPRNIATRLNDLDAPKEIVRLLEDLAATPA